jgi:hypothetical protein
MSNIASSFKAATWRKFFLENDKLRYSDSLLPQVRETGNYGLSPSTIFNAISKNPGIGLLCLYADGDKLIMLHNPSIIGGSWLQADTKLVALSGFDSKTIAVKIKESSIIDTKYKVPKWQDIQATIESRTSLKDIKGFKDVYLYKNILPVPNALVRSYLTLSSFDPDSVALAFYNTMCHNDQDSKALSMDLLASPDPSNNPDNDETTPLENDDSPPSDDHTTPITRLGAKQLLLSLPRMSWLLLLGSWIFIMYSTFATFAAWAK